MWLVSAVELVEDVELLDCVLCCDSADVVIDGADRVGKSFDAAGDSGRWCQLCLAGAGDSLEAFLLTVARASGALSSHTFLPPRWI